MEPSRLTSHDDRAPAAARRTPAQQRVWSQLLAADDRRTDRPPADTAIAAQLRDRVRRQAAGALARIPEDRTVWLSKTALSALRCDGRYLDHLATPFAWSPATVAGQLAHTAVEVDLAGARRRSTPEIVDYAWHHLAASGSSAGRYLQDLDGVEADALHAEAVRRCLSFRECFPHLPAWLHARTEVGMTWRVTPRLIVKGVPDLVVGRPDPTHRLLQIIELKTGGRYLSHREDLHLYALLATIKYGVAPFRVATYYLDEAQWDADDVSDALLCAAADRLTGQIERAIALSLDPPKEANLRLEAGPACSWCRRAPDCPLSARRLPMAA